MAERQRIAIIATIATGVVCCVFAVVFTFEGPRTWACDTFCPWLCPPKAETAPVDGPIVSERIEAEEFAETRQQPASQGNGRGGPARAYAPAPGPSDRVEVSADVPGILPEIEPGPDYVLEPMWVSRPAAERISALGRSDERAGTVVLDCLVGPNGGLACQVERETSLGAGFGDHAVRFATGYRMRQLTRDGRLTSGRRVRMQIRVQADGSDAVVMSGSGVTPLAPPDL
jgi:hypothetical protein